jgi:hypothetical protein
MTTTTTTMTTMRKKSSLSSVGLRELLVGDDRAA